MASKKGVELAWSQIVIILIVLALILFFIFFSGSIKEQLIDKIKSFFNIFR
ncbi:hypothetical protein KY330_00760 [Candidatus Woesearchaeota archaeon]|nr:hypothetical protein [Candidatus Woesearchaeota archaeon]